jgi:hypothetical protein
LKIVGWNWVMNMGEKHKQIINILENKILETHLLLKDSNSKRYITFCFFPIFFHCNFSFFKPCSFNVFSLEIDFLDPNLLFVKPLQLSCYVCLLCCIVNVLIKFSFYVIRMESLPNFPWILIIITSTLMSQVIICFLQDHVIL